MDKQAQGVATIEYNFMINKHNESPQKCMTNESSTIQDAYHIHHKHPQKNSFVFTYDFGFYGCNEKKASLDPAKRKENIQKCSMGDQIHRLIKKLQRWSTRKQESGKAAVLQVGFMNMIAVKLGPKLSETLKGKLSLGARIIQEGGRGNIFKHIFGMQKGEQFLKASQCYLYTTAGPIAGVLFISTKKVAFCSERPITFSSAGDDLVRAPYKVLIPTLKIKEVNEGQNVNKTEQKYVEIVTLDDSEFWFMGFLRYEKAFSNLQKAISMSNKERDN
ncbi:hypothetical protein VNO77_00409 [Canavalia gladiata]|uniref:GRAM domain-containing protein n=1 Tax=Canavalia gladiata TaxID=3824 RepID=A0AAN9MR33_CANGL